MGGEIKVRENRDYVYICLINLPQYSEINGLVYKGATATIDEGTGLIHATEGNREIGKIKPI